MRPHYSLLTPPNSEPITTAQATAHVRIDSEDDFAYLESLIPVAREYVDSTTGRVSASCGWKLVAPSWNSILASTECMGSRWAPLFRTPLVSIQSVKYYAPDADTLTVMDSGDYEAITTVEPGLIYFKEALPSADTNRPDSIQIEFTAGYSQPELASPILRHAVKMLVAHFYEQRIPIAFASASEIPFGLRNLIENQKVGGWVA